MTARRRWITRAALAACALVPLALVAAYVVNPMGARSMDPRERLLGVGLYRVPGASMAPTLAPGAIVVVRAGDAAVRDLHRGDLVVFAPPHHPGQAWIKRLIGLPGDTVALHDGRLLVNGRDVAEPYVDPARAVRPYSRDFDAVRVPPGRVFLLGDNRDNSEDSRFWGFAELAKVRGRATPAQAASYAP